MWRWIILTRLLGGLSIDSKKNTTVPVTVRSANRTYIRAIDPLAKKPTPLAFKSCATDCHMLLLLKFKQKLG
jgi:hypothetical protein